MMSAAFLVQIDWLLCLKMYVRYAIKNARNMRWVIINESFVNEHHETKKFVTIVSGQNNVIRLFITWKKVRMLATVKIEKLQCKHKYYSKDRKAVM